jgi:hypothetical protein
MRAIFSSPLVEDPAIFEAGVGEERGEGEKNTFKINEP